MLSLLLIWYVCERGTGLDTIEATFKLYRCERGITQDYNTLYGIVLIASLH